MLYDNVFGNLGFSSGPPSEKKIPIGLTIFSRLTTLSTLLTPTNDLKVSTIGVFGARAVFSTSYSYVIWI